MGLVAGKVALVTGAGSGIGRATAALLAREGAAVTVADRNGDAARETAAALIAAGARTLALQVDVADPAQVEAMARAAVETFGRLDCAVNCAGVAGRSGPVGEMSEEVWETNLAINLTGLAYCMKHEIARMGPRGSVVNIASGAGLEGVRGAAAYVASKHGVIGLTKTAALDHAKQNIRINALCPGLIATPMTRPGLESGHLDMDALCPMGRAGRPEEVAEAAVWLCSDRASYVTGAALPIDGGHLAG